MGATTSARRPAAHRRHPGPLHRRDRGLPAPRDRARRRRRRLSRGHRGRGRRAGRAAASGVGPGPVACPVRFLAYLQAVVTLDLGWSVAANQPVIEAIVTRVPNTILLMGAGDPPLGAPRGGLLGAFAAMRRGGPTDTAITSASLALNAMPNFWVALILIVVFVVTLDWFPLSGMNTIGGPTDPIGRTLDTAWHLVLPVLTLSLTYMAIYMRLMRGAMIETRSAGWVRAARARGLPIESGRARPHRAAGPPARRHDARAAGRRHARRQRRHRDRVRHPGAGQPRVSRGAAARPAARRRRRPRGHDPRHRHQRGRGPQLLPPRPARGR